MNTVPVSDQICVCRFLDPLSYRMGHAYHATGPVCTPTEGGAACPAHPALLGTHKSYVCHY